ncbi:MAG: GNAT family N-acetyltransferase [Methylocystaceae bacterium]|nr:GNAT family N-acetyltransferase [Methylocystaceae bacterium]
MSLTIRLVETATELKIVADLFRQYQNWLGGDLCFQGFEKELSDLPAHYDCLLLAYWDDRVCGCIGLKPYQKSKTACEMKRLFVLEDFRNKGIARKLMDQSFTEARQLGYQTMCLETLPELEIAHRLYGEIGFQIRENGDQNKSSKITFMEKSL